MLIPEDIADEIGRTIGYEHLPAVMPPELPDVTLPDKTFFYAELIKNLLVERGYSETLLYSLVKKGTYEVAYPLASDKSALRESLGGKMSEALIMNSRNADLLSLDAIKIFEIGKVFTKEGEQTALGIGVAQVKKKKGITSEGVLKADIAALESALGTPLKADIMTGEFGAVAEILLDGVIAALPPQRELAYLGFVSLPRNIHYKKFSPYPFITRDIAVFVPEHTNETEVHDIIQRNAGPLCIKSWLFDVFTKEFPEGKKTSYAFRLIFQSFDRTLEDREVNEIMEGISQKMAERPGWQIR